MLSLLHASIQFGGRILFEDLSFMVGPHGRIGLVGSNGAGKSTLLKIIAGLVTPDTGEVLKARYVTVGYLPQDGVTAQGRTLYDEVESAFEDILTVQDKLREAQDNLSRLDPSAAEYMETLDVFGELQHQLEDLDAFRMKSKIERVLLGLGFSMGDLERRTEEFSGGWQMRIELAKLLLKEPSILLLDEPTNHLDIESLQWLEEYLASYNGAVILVSHDRAFLDGLTNKTLALRIGKIEEYVGNYSFYEKERAFRRELLLNVYNNQQQQIKQTRQFIERFRYKATKARQVQSRIKQLEKMELIEIEDQEEEIHFEFPSPPPSGRVVVELKDLDKSYGDDMVFRGLTYSIERRDHIAIVGVNGAGKSTLARILAGVEPFNIGERVLGHNVVLSYFAQHQAEELDLSKDVLQTVDDVAAGEIRTKLRTLLGSFLFHGDDVFKKVSVLSGGEKSRLALVKMLLQPANFLVMDEPTNHLDMRSKTVLQEALHDYEGTYVIVSHDRAFLDPIVNKVAEVAHAGVKMYLGNVSDYLHRKKEERELEAAAHPAEAEASRSSFNHAERQLSDRERKRTEAERRQEIYRKTLPLRKKVEALEKEIEGLEAGKSRLEARMGDPALYRDGDEAKAMLIEYEEVKERLDEAYEEWLRTSERIADIQRGSLTE